MYCVMDRLSTRHKWQFILQTDNQDHARLVYEAYKAKESKWHAEKRPGVYPTAQIAITHLDYISDLSPLPAGFKPDEIETIGCC